MKKKLSFLKPGGKNRAVYIFPKIVFLSKSDIMAIYELSWEQSMINRKPQDGTTIFLLKFGVYNLIINLRQKVGCA